MTAGKLSPIYNSGFKSVQGLANARWCESVEIAILLESVFLSGSGMNINETVAVFPSADHRVIDEADDDIYDAQLSDDEILMAFLSDGCDLDGTPLLMLNEQGVLPRTDDRMPTLH